MNLSWPQSRHRKKIIRLCYLKQLITQQKANFIGSFNTEVRKLRQRVLYHFRLHIFGTEAVAMRDDLKSNDDKKNNYILKFTDRFTNIVKIYKLKTGKSTLNDFSSQSLEQ